MTGIARDRDTVRNTKMPSHWHGGRSVMKQNAIPLYPKPLRITTPLHMYHLNLCTTSVTCLHTRMKSNVSATDDLATDENSDRAGSSSRSSP